MFDRHRADETVSDTNHSYSATTAWNREPVPPVAHHTVIDTFK
jgi:hypothetical protein